MFKKIFQQLKFKMMARQLRRPAGPMGGKVGTMMNKANEFLYDFTLDVMKPARHESVLEIGYGNGKFFDKLFSKAAELKITGIDFSAAMFAAAKKNNRENLANGNLSLHFGSSDMLPFADNSFDKIFCINVIYFWDEPGNHLNEIHRVLRAGGRFYATIRTKESMMKMPFTRYGFAFYDADKWRGLIEKTNFLFNGTVPVDEPAVEFEGNQFQVQSLCLINEKKIL